MKSVRWAVALLIVIAVAITVALAFRGGIAAPAGEPTAAPTATPTSPEPTPTATGNPTGTPGMLTIARTSDPDVYADSVAAFVFSMDARAFDPEHYRAALLNEADPLMNDAGLADLERTVDERIPDATRWGRMRANQQWSTWSPTVVWEPQTWAEVVTDGLAEPGWVMRNVTGTQTTSYAEQGEDRTAMSEPTVTIAMRCPAPSAAVDRCRLTVIGTTVLP